MQENNMPINKVYTSFSIISTVLTDQHIDILKDTFPTIKIQENRTYTQSKEVALPSSKSVNASSDVTSPYTGSGVRVAILDSGVDTNHHDLNVKGGYCSLGNECAYGIPYDDDNGHGTHVAGIVGALGLSSKGIKCTEC